MGEDRAVSPVIGVVLMVAVTALLAATVGSFFLGLGGEQSEAAPQVAKSDGELIRNDSIRFDQRVIITHRGGEAVQVSDLEIQVSFSGHSEQSTLTGVPTDSIDSSDYEGDDVWDGRTGGIGGALASNEDPGRDGMWTSGEALKFRIAHLTLDDGETVTVTVVHQPSKKILFESELTVKKVSHVSPGDVSPVGDVASTGRLASVAGTTSTGDTAAVAGASTTGPGTARTLVGTGAAAGGSSAASLLAGADAVDQVAAEPGRRWLAALPRR
jgi:flagellin-like protein